MTIPGEITLNLAPVECAEYWADEHDVRSLKPSELDITRLRQYSANTVRSVWFAQDALLGSSAALATINATDARDFTLRGTLDISRQGTLHGLLGTFRAQMARGVHMTNDPSDSHPMRHRWQSLLPIEQSVAVSPGDIVEVVMRASPTRYNVSWRGRVLRGSSTLATFRQASFLGEFAPQGSVERARQAMRPQVAPARAELSARCVALADGSRSVDEICEELTDLAATTGLKADELRRFITETLRLCTVNMNGIVQKFERDPAVGGTAC